MRALGRLLLLAAVGAISGAAGAAILLRAERRYRLAADQEWFWRPEWLAGEAQASEDIAAGRVEVFEEADHFLKTMFKEAELEYHPPYAEAL